MWQSISRSTYRHAFECFGGSFKVHPDVVDLAQALTGREARYLGFKRRGALVAAVPLWDSYVVASNAALHHFGYQQLIDVGDEEVVLPIAADARVSIPFESDLISDLQQSMVSNAVCSDGAPLMISSGISQRSAETLSKLRRLHRLFIQSGGEERPIGAFPPREIAEAYSRLFSKRWRCAPVGISHLQLVLQALKELTFGSVLVQGGEVVAISINYKVETPRWILCNGVNQGIDHERRDRSLGTLLMYLNLMRAEELAIASGKALRFSFGTLDHAYKKQWCREVEAYRLAKPTRFGFAGFG